MCNVSDCSNAEAMILKLHCSTCLLLHRCPCSCMSPTDGDRERLHGHQYTCPALLLCFSPFLPLPPRRDRNKVWHSSPVPLPSLPKRLRERRLWCDSCRMCTATSQPQLRVGGCQMVPMILGDGPVHVHKSVSFGILQAKVMSNDSSAWLWLRKC